MTRRLVQIETAVSRSPLNPDFTGLEMVLEDPIGAGGEANTSTFNNWLAGKLKEKANIAKQSRLFKEEFRSGKGVGSQDWSGAEISDGGKGKGKGKGAKAKAKAAAKSAGGGDKA